MLIVSRCQNKDSTKAGNTEQQRPPSAKSQNLSVWGFTLAREKQMYRNRRGQVVVFIMAVRDANTVQAAEMVDARRRAFGNARTSLQVQRPSRW